MSETIFNNFVAIGASNRLSVEQVKLLQRAVDNEIRRTNSDNYSEIAELDKMGNDLMVIASKMEAGE
jgi:hypothetical protein